MAFVYGFCLWPLLFAFVVGLVAGVVICLFPVLVAGIVTGFVDVGFVVSLVVGLAVGLVVGFVIVTFDRGIYICIVVSEGGLRVYQAGRVHCCLVLFMLKN